VAVAETAVGIRLAGLYDDIAINYYVFVAVFVAYAFPARSVVAGYVVLLSIASALPLLYGPAKVGETAARTVVAVLLLVVVAGIVTLLREGLQRRQLELEELAVRDPLTGVGNYRLLSERLEYEIVRHRRSGEPLTVMLLDLDNFKDINDTFGHLAGDRALVEVAAALESCVRARDTVARQGGDEFSILAPETGEDAAQVLARRVQEAIVTATSGTLSASVGWATFPAGAEQSSALLALADADLWRVKRQRRTRHRSRSAPTGRPSTAGIA
jgi:diguanylate cyclase (GGDEF)-like protein